MHEGVKVKLNSVDLTEFSYGVLATNNIITTCNTWGLAASDRVSIQASLEKKRFPKYMGISRFQSKFKRRQISIKILADNMI